MWKKLILLVLVAVVGHRAWKLVWNLGYHKHVFNHQPGPCRSLAGIDHGAEDMQLLPGGKVLIPSGMRFMDQKTSPRFKGVKGQVFVLDMNDPSLTPKEVTIKGDLDLDTFNPLGITAWIDTEKDRVTIFIGNHDSPQSVVEKFRYDDAERTLHHTETIGRGDDTFRVLNNFVAVSEDQFYFTNFFHSSHLEMLFQLYWGTVGFYDGRQGRVVASGYLVANGINMSPDGKYVYVNHIFDEELRIYRREKDNSLTVKSVVPLHTWADNLIVDPDTGDLWTASGAVTWRVAQYMDNPRDNQSPAQVLRLKVKDGEVTDVTEVLANDGSLLSAATVALLYKDRLFVGSIYTNAIVCDIKYIK